jgi:CRISPR-associated protein Csm5
MALLRLKVDTPLFVLGGGSAVVGLDAFYKEGRLYLVDITSPKLMATATTGASLEELVKLASSNPAQYAYRSFPSPQIQDKTEVKIGVVPPASTIKGLLRTAYLWLALTQNHKLANDFLDTVANALNRGVQSKAVGSLRTRSSYSTRLCVQPKAVGSAGEALVFKQVLEGGRRWDIFNLVAVREKGAKAEFRVYKVDVYKRTSVIATFYAAGLAPGSELEYEVVVWPRPRQVGGSNVVLTEQVLKDALRLFSEELAAFEQERGLYVPQCNAVRLGFGAGRRWKTVLSLIEKMRPHLFRRLESYMSHRIGRIWDDITFKMADEKPVGWACYEWR